MPQELDRIKELAGLQQEAPAKKKLKYSSSQYAQALSQLQLRNHKGELHTITPKQQQKIIDIIEQHGFGVELQNYLHKINVINKYAAVSEAPAAGDQALAKEIAKLYKEIVEVINDNSDNPDDIESDYNWGYGPDDDEEARALMKAFNTSLQAGLQLVKKIKIERGKSLLGDESDWDPFHPQSERHNELKAMFAKYGKKIPEESAVQEAPGAEINNSTMPTELNRIKELAGLQQEAAAISPNQIEAFKKWYATYSKMQSKDVYNYAKGIFKAYMETGVTELDGASKQDPRGKAYDDLAKIFPDMDGDIEAIGNALQSQGVDPLDMEAEEDEDNARLRLKAMAGQESISQVDEAIKKARAQLKSFSNFDGLKPYKPKKK